MGERGSRRRGRGCRAPGGSFKERQLVAQEEAPLGAAQPTGGMEQLPESSHGKERAWLSPALVPPPSELLHTLGCTV